MRTSFQLLSVLTIALISSATCGAEPSILFNRDIRPILAEACLSCHGPDSASRQADLRLDKREVAVEQAAIVPGNPDASELVRRILSKDPTERMPPPITKKTLMDAQKQLLVRWIRTGAEYQPHWSLIPPTRPPLPQVRNSAWVRNPIDNFVAARLEAAGLKPAAEADRRSLARRLSLDLVGLPPTPESVDEFVNDPHPEAYERLVDKLLASPHWGEHRARYWLDAARYADSSGIHFDNYREMWSYRDWVINAFNRNMPFDEFTIENLAGDLLPNATREQQIGSGFNRCNITTNEGGAIEEEYLVLYARDRVETTSQVWMGLTAGCAVCHDHKFDPLKQREFYQLTAFFNNTTQKGLDGNVKDTPPVLRVIESQDQARWNELKKAIPELQQELAARRIKLQPEFGAWLASNPQEPDITDSKIPGDSQDFVAAFDEAGDKIHYSSNGQPFDAPLSPNLSWQPGRAGKKCILSNHGEILAAPGSCDFECNQPFSISAWIKLRDNDPMGAIVARMDDRRNLRGWDVWLENRRVGFHLIDQWPTSAISVSTASEYPPGQWFHVTAVYDGSGKASGIRLYLNGQLQRNTVQVDSLSGTIRNNVPFKISARNNSAALNGLQMEDLFIYGRALTEGEIPSLMNARLPAIFANSAEKRTPEESGVIFTWWLQKRNPEYSRLERKYDRLLQEQSEIIARGTTALVMREKAEPPISYVLHRGEYDQREEKVGPETPAMLPALPAGFPRNRLGFARWLLLPSHPLTSRVTVNRFWSEVFGTGLVKTAGDFGVQGELPSHPELLDWLAVDFRETGWDVKRLLRLIVTSATYRQTNVASPESIERDPENRLLSHGPRFRMDAEMVRDYALSASGLLSPKIGGPSVRPYQPRGVWEAVAMLQSNTRTYQQDVGDSIFRRSIYTFWKRAAPPASMDIFNAPAREVCTMVRERTNTPLQALVTMNDPQFVEAARQLAQRAIEAKPSTNDRIQFVAERLLARQFHSDEMEVVRKSLQQFENYFSTAPDEAAKLIKVGDSMADTSISAVQLAAWTMVANQMMNLDEVLNK